MNRVNGAISRALLDAIEEVASDQTTLAEILAVAEILDGAGIEASALRAIQRAGLTLSLGQQEQALPQPLAWYLAVQRWPVACRACAGEVRRGELANLGKLRSGEWIIECSACRELDPCSERADDARKRAIEKDDDPEQLIERMRELAPRDLHERIEDLLMVVVAAREGG